MQSESDEIKTGFQSVFALNFTRLQTCISSLGSMSQRPTVWETIQPPNPDLQGNVDLVPQKEPDGTVRFFLVVAKEIKAGDLLVWTEEGWTLYNSIKQIKNRIQQQKQNQ